MEKLEYRDHGLSVDVYLGFLDPEESKHLYDAIEEQVVWPRARSYHKRRNITFGDQGLTYQVSFAGGGVVKRHVIKWPSFLVPIRDQVDALVDQQSTICVLQEYPSGKVGINPHRDKEMTPGTTISGVSVGQERTLVMGTWSEPEEYKIGLPDGSLYVLNPPTNDKWSHSIKKDDSLGIRYSLTFRNYQPL